MISYTLRLLAGSVLLFLAVTLLVGCGPDPEYEACKQRGIQYYKEIGSYPRLSTGQKAEDAVRSRCLRFNGAF